jgi:hypothetical protein
VPSPCFVLASRLEDRVSRLRDRSIASRALRGLDKEGRFPNRPFLLGDCGEQKIPNPNDQIPGNFQITKKENTIQPRVRIRDLEIEVYLGFGRWDLDFPAARGRAVSSYCKL